LIIRLIETGDWTTYELIEYLVSIQPITTTQEFERLRQASAFPKERAVKERSPAGVDRKVQRYKAEDLYQPIDIFRDFGLPIIDWGADNLWDPKSNNGKLLWVVVENPSGLPIAQPNTPFHWV